MQLTDVNGNIYGAGGLEITGADGKPKTTGGVTPAALTKVDDTNVTLTLGGSPSNSLLQAVSLTLGWTGTLADSRIASASTWNAKQNALVSGTNIKTVNSNSLLGSGNLSVGTVTSVAALTLGTTGTDLSSTVANSTSTPVITLNVPTASATNRGALSSTDWSTFNGKQNALTLTTTGTTGAATLVGSTLNIPQYSNAGTTVYVANANSVTFTNGTQWSIYLGGTPVTPVQITAGIYGGISTDFMPGYPMPAGVASKTRVTLRSANPATNALEVYVANATASTRGAVLTIPAGSAAGIYTADDNTTVSFTTGQRLYFMVRNPNVVGGAASGQVSTLSFNYTLS